MVFQALHKGHWLDVGGQEGGLDAVVDQVGRPPKYIGHSVGHDGDHWTIKDLSKECHVWTHTGVSISIFARAF